MLLQGKFAARNHIFPVTPKDVTKVGKDVYQTREQAEADVKGLCKEPNAAAPTSTPRNAE